MTRLFMVEDDEPVATLVGEVSASNGWEVKVAGTVKEALAQVKDFKPDIILLDVHLPDGDGYQFCSKLREDASFAKVPVIFMTVRGDVQSRLKGFAAGAQDYVSKPFSVEELMARMRAHLDIKVRIDALAKEKEELALRDRVRQDMIDMVVHDLRTPLGSIRMTLDLLHKSGLITSDQYGMTLRNAEDATEFALLMVNDFLDERAGKVRVELAPVDLGLIVTRLRSMFQPQVAGRKLKFQVELPETGAKPVSDATLLMRVLANFLQNSIKFSQSGMTVILRVALGSGRLRFEVQDMGPGVPDAEKELVFDKFYRAEHPQSRAAPGTGIGLAFCRLAADQLGGRAWVEDAKGGGSVFLIEVPDGGPAAA